MSAEPIRPEIETEPAAVPATVLAFRRPRRMSREPHVPTQPGPDTGPDAGRDLTPEQKLAATVEAAFARHRRSLTDPDTAEDYTITLGVVITLLTGARDQGLLQEEQFGTLDSMVQGLLAAPRLLA